MVGMDHGPSESEPDDPATSARNARWGMWLFVGYLAVYVGYVLLVTFRPDWMRKMPLAGINLAIAYGLFLIVSAFLLALLYAWLCRRPVNPFAAHTSGSLAKRGTGREV